MEIKYPVYYAIEKMYNSDGKCIGCIVSKCYLLEEKKKYFVNGHVKEEYKVSFPYTELDCFGSNIDLTRRNIPGIDNIVKVNSIFENYDNAALECYDSNVGRSEYERIKLETFQTQVMEGTEDLIINSENNNIENNIMQRSRIIKSQS